MYSPIVSVIVPVYRVEAYLSECVDSILVQTFTDFELILVDDGSPDRAGAICDSYAESDIRVRVIHQKNLGLSEARNAGIDLARGAFLTFVDSDDWVSPDYLFVLHSLLVQHDADVSACHFVAVTETPANSLRDAFRTVTCYSREQALSLLHTSLAVPAVTSTAKLFRTSLFQAVRFPAGRLHEDEFTTYRIYGESRKVVFTSEQLYFYRQRADSIMTSHPSLGQRLDAIEALKNRADYLGSIGLSDAAAATYRTVFGIQSEIRQDVVRSCERELVGRFLHDMRAVLLELRKGTQPPSVRAFSRFYPLAPRVMDGVYRHRRAL